MPFVHESHEPGPVVGHEHELERVFIYNLVMPTDACIGLHRHDGDEVIRVLDGEVEFVVDGERRRCGPGTAAVVPPGTEHGFVVRREARLEVIGEQRMGEFVTVVQSDGTRAHVEAHTEGIPWVRPPEDGVFDSIPQLLDMMATTTAEVRGEPG